MRPLLPLLALGSVCAAQAAAPKDEPLQITELPLPPAIASKEAGACDKKANPRGTGCIAQDVGEFQAGDFTPDGSHIVVNVVFVGAPEEPDPASIYTGEQLILVNADGGNFTNGDAWKCLSCGVPAENKKSLDDQRDYPHVFRSGDKVLWGHNVVDCGELVQSDKCTPDQTHIYPIHWPTAKDGKGKGGSPRELRLHPDDRHMGWSSFTDAGGQWCYFGRLEFNEKPTVGEPLAPRYDLVDVNVLHEAGGKEFVSFDGGEMQFNADAKFLGELRGFSGTGDEVTYIGYTTESNNIDLYAIHLETGKVRRLTSHPEYADPIAFQADDSYFVTMDTRGSDRQMWMSGMRAIPPVLDLVTVTAASSTRNNGVRRFFQPILIDGAGDRDGYYGQQVNAAGDGSNGAINDANWNGRADPAFSLDGTRITYWQALVVSPQCGGANPLKCPKSTAQGGREYRVMVAERTSRTPKDPPPVFEVADKIPWATLFPPGATPPAYPSIKPGNFTLTGKVSGSASVVLGAMGKGRGTYGIDSVSVVYRDFADDDKYTLNGYENATVTVDASNPWLNTVNWFSDLTQTGDVKATKKTSEGGYHLTVDASTNEFSMEGELTTTIDGKEYKQPANGT